jgi:hypothetical protein
MCCLAVDVAPLPVSRPLHRTNVSEPFASNGCFSGSTVLALSKYATMLWLKSIYFVRAVKIRQTYVGINGIKDHLVTEK